MKRVAFIVLPVLLSVVLYRLAESRPDGLYAEMETSKGRVVFRLYYDKVPMTVANFVSLAEGSNTLVKGDRKDIPFYDGLTFQKVIPGVMVLGGDPKGTGNGGPGFRFRHEFRPDLRHDRPGILSMLNDGAFSHGSRFFITLKETPPYDDKHTIFGAVVEGESVVERLAEGDAIQRISIVRQGKDASAFDLAGSLRELERSAGLAEAEARRQAHDKADRSRNLWKETGLPNLTGKTDPARVPSDNQPESQKVALQYLLVSHREAIPRLARPTPEKPKARKIAEHLVALAREERTDFVDLARRFSDSPDYRIPLLIRDGQAADTLLPCFRLRPGQVSDAIDTPKGFMIFRRVPLELIEVRHILISYSGARGGEQSRTREAAKRLAEALLLRARNGEEFAELARQFSDSDSASRGGRLGEIARGMTVAAFDHAAFGLKVGEISNVTLTPAGYQIIQRVK